MSEKHYVIALEKGYDKEDKNQEIYKRTYIP